MFGAVCNSNANEMAAKMARIKAAKERKQLGSSMMSSSHSVSSGKSNRSASSRRSGKLLSASSHQLRKSGSKLMLLPPSSSSLHNPRQTRKLSMASATSTICTFEGSAAGSFLDEDDDCQSLATESVVSRTPTDIAQRSVLELQVVADDDDSGGDELDFVTVERVYSSWGDVKSIANYKEYVGGLILNAMCDIDADAVQVKLGIVAALEDETFVQKSQVLVEMMDEMVNLMGPYDCWDALVELGKREVLDSKLIPAFAQSVAPSLQQALRRKDCWTPETQEAWTTFLNYAVRAMTGGSWAC